MFEREVPTPLVKRLPPKERVVMDEWGHSAPDFLWTIALILFIFVMLRMLGVL